MDDTQTPWERIEQAELEHEGVGPAPASAAPWGCECATRSAGSLRISSPSLLIA
jgi:hypothetical protein